MANKKDCFNIIKEKIFNNELKNEAALKQMVEDMLEIKALTKDNNQLYARRTSEYVREVKELNLAEKANLTKAQETLKRNIQVANAAPNPGEGLLSQIEGSNKSFEGAQDSANARRNALIDDYGNKFIGSIESSPVYKTFASGELDESVEAAINALAKGLDVEKIDPHVLDIAKKIRGFNEYLRRDMLYAGVPVRKFDSFVSKQNHDRAKVTAVGKEAWIKRVREFGLDPAMFGHKAGDVNFENKALGEIYDGIIGGKDQAVDADSLAQETLVSGRTANYGKQMSQSRVLKFADGEGGFSRYNKEFGSGTLFESLTQNLMRQARQLSLVEKFGPNPEKGLWDAYNQLLKKYTKEGNEKKVTELKSYENAIRDSFNYQSGKTTAPGKTNKAFVGRMIGAVESLSKLGSAGLASVTNLATASSMIKSRTGDNFLKTVGTTVRDFVETLPKENRRKLAETTGVVLEDFHADLVLQLTEGMTKDSFQTGMGRVTKNFFKYTGLEMMTKGFGRAYALGMQKRLGNMSEVPFKDLPPAMQGGFLRAGINEKDWSVISKATETLDNGQKIISVDKIKDQEIDPPKGMTKERYARELERKMMTYYHSGAMLASTSSGTREGRMLLGFTTEDEWGGLARRLITRFKGFPLQIMNIMGEIANNSSPNSQALREGRMYFAGKKNYAAMAELAVGMTALAYVVDSLKAVANGTDFRDPSSPDTWKEMLVRGGSAGLMGDLFLGEADNAFRNTAKDLLGPTIGTAIDLNNIQKKALEGKNVSKDLTRLIRNNLPLQNVPFIKAGMDYIHHDILNEALNPGYKNKRLLNEKKRQLQGGMIRNPLTGGE